MAKGKQKRLPFGRNEKMMTNFNQIYEEAVDNYGLINAKKIRDMGIKKQQVQRYLNDGRLDKVGHGVYKITQYVPVREDQYAKAVALVGDDAYLYGTAVLALLELALVNPNQLTIATNKRVRKKLPKWIKIVNTKNYTPVNILGIPAQNLFDAFQTCKNKVMPDRLNEAIEEARKQGYLTRKEYEKLKVA